jgi:molybdate transport system substrate-binding protein
MSGLSRRLSLGFVTGLTLSLPVHAEQITVFAAASLKTALDKVATEWNAVSDDQVVVSYAGSAALAKQIQQGAPADIFISAAVEWMDLLQDQDMIVADSRRDLLGNLLVLVGFQAPDAPVTIDSDFDLAGRLAGGKLAMGLVTSVPAGVYGKQSLDHLGLWDSINSNVAQADNVRAALALVATGEAPLGIVYATDAVAEPKVGVVGTFPADSHDPIVYPAAVTADSAHYGAADFLNYLHQDSANAVFAGQGFTVIGHDD